MAPPTQDNRQRIIAAAREAFMTEGYRSSIDHIAQIAGVAKQTVYNHFPTKEALFDEMTSDNMNLFLVSLSDSPDNPRQALLEFGRKYYEVVLTGQCVAWMRMIAAEAPRFPDMAARTYKLGPVAMLEQLTEYLSRAMASKKLRKDDPQLAAEILYGMLSGAERTRMLFGAEREPYDQEKRVTAIIDCFMRAYQP
ncbi:MAG TPA: TetR/AcrR family transcriptional regulator [Rhodocyclaceae bacterium]|nr:TetR/AcrR family transcriptional regulator [Rhodocyclaceae bacterium]